MHEVSCALKDGIDRGSLLQVNPPPHTHTLSLSSKSFPTYPHCPSLSSMLCLAADADLILHTLIFSLCVLADRIAEPIVIHRDTVQVGCQEAEAE